MMRNWMSEEIMRLFWVLLAGGIMGLLLGYPIMGLLISLLAYLVYVINQLVKVNRWIVNPKRNDIPA